MGKTISFYSFVFIQMLEQYCKTNKIILMWNIYDDDNIELIQHNDTIFAMIFKCI